MREQSQVQGRHDWSTVMKGCCMRLLCAYGSERHQYDKVRYFGDVANIFIHSDAHFFLPLPPPRAARAILHPK